VKPEEEEKDCNVCGLTCWLGTDGNPSNANYGLINASVMGGYESTPGNGEGALDDMTKYTFNVCEFCCDWLFTHMKIAPHVAYQMGDATEEEEAWRSAEERIKTEPQWRKNSELFFIEKTKRDRARSSR
jgi:hypothetical protein